MNVGGCHIQKEWLALSLVNPVNRFLRQRCPDLIVVKQLVRLLRSTELVSTTLRCFRWNGRNSRHPFCVPAKMNQRISRVSAEHSIVLNINIRRRAVYDGHAEVVIEPKILGAGTQRLLPCVLAFAKSEVPFSERGCSVAFVFEDISDRGFVSIDKQRRFNRRWPPHSTASTRPRGSQGILPG